MLTLKMLQQMPENTIFATGVLVDDKDGLFMANTKKELRWVAVRGGIADWSIYCHFADRNIEWIRHYGDKVYDENNIKRCIEADEEALAYYRY